MPCPSQCTLCEQCRCSLAPRRTSRSRSRNPPSARPCSRALLPQRHNSRRGPLAALSPLCRWRVALSCTAPTWCPEDIACTKTNLPALHVHQYFGPKIGTTRKHVKRHMQEGKTRIHAKIQILRLRSAYAASTRDGKLGLRAECGPVQLRSSHPCGPLGAVAPRRLVANDSSRRASTGSPRAPPSSLLWRHATECLSRLLGTPKKEQSQDGLSRAAKDLLLWSALVPCCFDCVCYVSKVMPLTVSLLYLRPRTTLMVLLRTNPKRTSVAG